MSRIGAPSDCECKQVWEPGVANIKRMSVRVLTQLGLLDTCFDTMEERHTMANAALFNSRALPAADTVNRAGGKAYRLKPEHALAQYAVTGCLNNTYYTSAQEQLTEVLELCKGVEPEFIAKTAIYCRESGYMKDMPALLTAALTTRDWDAFQAAFARTIDNGKMLRNFVQIIRSGAVGRKSLGSNPKRLVQKWLDARSDEAIFFASVGQSPSMVDIIKMVHPKPKTPSREALYGYLLGKPHTAELLPPVVKAYEAFKADATQPVPDVPFQMLAGLSLQPKHWVQIARNAPWQATRMNLNTFLRHDVFTWEVDETSGESEPQAPVGSEGLLKRSLKKLGLMGKASEPQAARKSRVKMSRLVADKLRDPKAIARSRVFPYQLMAAYLNADEKMPAVVLEALQDAMELAINNVPSLKGKKIFVLPDVSGSMSSPVTGQRTGATSKMRCIDVAALVAAAVLRKNPGAEVLPFENKVVSLKLNPKDSVMTNAQKLAAIGGGGTSCSAPLKHLNDTNASGDLVIFVSDNESWMDPRSSAATATMMEWDRFKSRNPKAKLVCIDLQPGAHTQAPDRVDILNVGGFSDTVFSVIADFVSGQLSSSHWVGVINQVSLASSDSEGAQTADLSDAEPQGEA